MLGELEILEKRRRMYQQTGVVEELIWDSFAEVFVPLSKIVDTVSKFLNPASERTIQQEIDQYNREGRVW